MLEALSQTDTETGLLCRYVRSDTEYFRPHFHNYYEIFLMYRGKACHFINGKEQLLNEGDLLFIRDFDIHNYSAVEGNYFEFINLAFTKETLNTLALYLGSAFPLERLISSKEPPTVSLNKREKERLFFALTDTPEASDKKLLMLKTRMLLADIFTSYFLSFTKKENEDIPVWLMMTVEKMKYPKNFIEGINKMYSICGKTREHLSRSLKKYYGISPTAFVNDLRLNYSANLLISSNLSVTDIAFESGFENISWFYTAFTQKYSLTPLKYRKKYEQLQGRDNN